MKIILTGIDVYEYEAILKKNEDEVIVLNGGTLGTFLEGFKKMDECDEVHMYGAEDTPITMLVLGAALSKGKKIKLVNYLYSNKILLNMIDSYSELLWSVEGDGELKFFTSHCKEAAISYMNSHVNDADRWVIYAENQDGLLIYGETFNSKGERINVPLAINWKKLTVKGEGVN